LNKVFEMSNTGGAKKALITKQSISVFVEKEVINFTDVRSNFSSEYPRSQRCPGPYNNDHGWINESKSSAGEGGTETQRDFYAKLNAVRP
jgi:hypothetical protein